MERKVKVAVTLGLRLYHSPRLLGLPGRLDICSISMHGSLSCSGLSSPSLPKFQARALLLCTWRGLRGATALWLRDEQDKAPRRTGFWVLCKWSAPDSLCPVCDEGTPVREVLTYFSSQYRPLPPPLHHFCGTPEIPQASGKMWLCGRTSSLIMPFPELPLKLHTSQPILHWCSIRTNTNRKACAGGRGHSLFQWQV